MLFAACPWAECRGLRVAFVGDPQVGSADELHYACASVYSELAGQKDIDLVIFLGDLTNDDMGLLGRTAEILDSLPVPYLAVPGNHDRDVYPGKDRTRDLVTFRRTFGYVDTAFVMNGVNFILMDNVRPTGRASYEGGLRTCQRHWLDSVLISLPPSGTTVFATHIPVSMSADRDSVLAAFAGRNDVLFVSGHTHTVARHDILRTGGNAVHEVIAGASCGSWWRGHLVDGIPYALQNCGAPRGYFLCRFGRNGYRLSYRAVGREDVASVYAGAVKDSVEVFVNVYGGKDDGRLRVRPSAGNGRRAGMKECSRIPAVAPEVLEVIASNDSMTREERRMRRNWMIPLRRIPSPHVWKCSLPGTAVPSGIEVIYSDSRMSFRRTVQVNPL